MIQAWTMSTLAAVFLLWGLICTCSSTSTGSSPGQKDNYRTTSQGMEMLSHGTESERAVIKIRPGIWITSCSNQLRDSLLHNSPLGLVKLTCAKDPVLINGKETLVKVDELQIQIVSTHIHRANSAREEMLDDFISTLYSARRWKIFTA